MKKIFMILATATALCFVGCKSSDPVIIVPEEEKGGKDNPETDSHSKTFVVNVETSIDYPQGGSYAAATASMPGDEILSFFDMDAEEFYEAIGSWEGDPASQINNTILFGLYSNSSYTWCPSNTNSLGHWVNANGELSSWGNDDSYIYIESNVEWGLGSGDEGYDDAVANMWEFTVGYRPDHFSGAVGDTYKVTQVFYYEDDDENENFAYVEWNITVTAGEEVEINIVDKAEIELDGAYYTDYTATDLTPYLDESTILSAIGLSSMDDVEVYALNSDGSVYALPATNFWFSIAGDVMSWGEGCGIDINKDAGYWTFCNYPDASVCGQANKGAIAFVNPETMAAYAFYLTVNIEAYDALKSSVSVSFEDGASNYTLTKDQITALAEALGVESIEASDIASTYSFYGVNADGSYYTSGSTADDPGYWFNSSSDVCTWSDVETAGYANCGYVCYSGDFTFAVGLWAESGYNLPMKVVVVNCDNAAVLTFDATVAEPAVYETTEAGTLSVDVTSSLAAGYTGGTFSVDEALSTLGVEFSGATMLDTEGGCLYTSNGGFWYNASGAVCSWGEDGCSFFCEPNTTDSVMSYGLFPDGAVAVGDKYTASFRLADLTSMKHVTVTLNVTVVE